MTRLFPALACLLLLTGPALATDPVVLDRVTLSVTARTKVPQSKLVAVLFAQEEGRESALLADSVNQRIALALDLAKNESGIKARTLGYQSIPYYQNQLVAGWRVRQSLELESEDINHLGELIGRLQSDLNVESVNYSVSEPLINATHDGLIDQAIAAFKQRSERIARAWGRSGYRLIQIAVQDHSVPPAPAPYPVGRVATLAAQSVAPPFFMAGDQELSIVVTGTIELSQEPLAQDAPVARPEAAPQPTPARGP